MIKILKGDQEILRTVAEEVTDITPELEALAVNMLVTMKEAGGIGLAAPQVGESVRLIVFDCSHGSGNSNDFGILYNPKIIHMSANTEPMEEGCLSFPKKYITVDRYPTVTVEYTSPGKFPMCREFTGVAAQVIQHEIEHLNGVLLIDHEEVKEDRNNTTNAKLF
jgi:peptide deformylase